MSEKCGKNYEKHLHFENGRAMMISMKVNHKVLILGMISLGMFGFGGTLLEGMALAAGSEAYQDSFDLKFTFNPTLTLTLGATELTINNLAPGTSGSSSAVNVAVATNNIAGYTLKATVGNASNPSTELRMNGTDTANKFNMISTSGSLAKGQWGYSTNGGSSFSGLELYTGTPTEINTSSTPTDGSTTGVTSFQIGAYADDAQITGSYTNVINFTAVTNQLPMVIETVTYLQDLYGISNADKTSLLASMTENQAYSLKDNRDEQSYYVAKLADGNIWFLDNLRLDLTNSTTKANTTPATTNASETALNCLTGRTTGCTSPYTTAADVDWGSSNSYTAAMSSATYATTIDSNSDNNWGNGSHMYGVYYNYCAASAGSYCYASNASPDGVNASEDICPAGWRMPTGGTTGEWGALNSLINNRTASDFASIQARLSLPLSDYFLSGSAMGQGSNGYWWSSTRYSGISMYYFGAYATGTHATDYGGRYDGYSVRCLFSAS